MRTHGLLVCEAGTGTGKTLAYLVPAILSGKRVVISTGTKNLQEQIYFKDLPALQRALLLVEAQPALPMPFAMAVIAMLGEDGPNGGFEVGRVGTRDRGAKYRSDGKETAHRIGVRKVRRPRS